VAPHVTTLAPYMKHDEARYAHTTSNTHVVQPWAFFMFLYQLPVWFPGWVFFVVLAGGLVLLIARWRRGWGKYAGLAWAVAVVNLVVPIAAVEPDYRYTLSAVPFACLALGLAFAPKRVATTAASAAAAAGAPTLGAAVPTLGAAGAGVPTAGAAGAGVPTAGAAGAQAAAESGSGADEADEG
jgi:hypothetical protein